MISSQLGAGYALVPQAPEWNPDSGGGPIRLAPGSNPVYAHAGNNVWRTPHLVVREAEPGGATWPGIDDMMFIQDGRLVKNKPIYTDNMFHGAAEVIMAPAAGSFAQGIRALVPAAAFLGGAVMGYRAADKHKMWGAIGGAVVGGILGRIFR